MTQTVRQFGVELEGYTSRQMVATSHGIWRGVSDGSLSYRTPDGGRTCENCHGQGSFTCEECEGTGRAYHTCSHCGGEHVIIANQETGRTSYCEHCDGEGDELIGCQHCHSSGSNNCETCNGSGRVYENVTIGHIGVEFITDTPIRELDEIDRIFNHTRQHHWYVDSTCGLHIHVDATDFDPSDIRKLVAFMTAVEPIVFSLNHERRYSGGYCKKMAFATTNDILRNECIDAESLQRAIYGRLLEGSPYKYADQRYHGVNLHSYFYRGTIEFRYFDGADNPEEVKNFVKLCVGIMEFIKNASYNQIQVIVDEMLAQGFDQRLHMLKTVLNLDCDFQRKSNIFDTYVYDVVPSQVNVAV